MRIVIDTNILASATINPHGNPKKVLSAWQEHRFQMIVSPQLLKEWRRVLSYARIRKYSYLDELGVDELFDVIESLSQTVDLIPKEIDPVIQNDPSDDVILATAIVGRADYIVSGDQHLLDLGEYKGIKIVSAAEFVRILEERR